MEIAINPAAPKPSTLLRQALELLGPNGEHWTKYKLKREVKPWWGLGFVTQVSYCALGGIAEVNTANQEAATRYLSRAVWNQWGNSVPYFNDHIAKDFSDIKLAFNEAIMLAEADDN